MYAVQVYVIVFADGPTRVLRFASVQDCGTDEGEHCILDLAVRLRYKLRPSSGAFTRASVPCMALVWDLT